MKTIQQTPFMPQTVYVRADSVSLEGELYVPDDARGVVIFVHGSGSHSPRDRLIAAKLHERRFATFILGLLTSDEEACDLRGGEFRFDIALLARRLGEATDSLARDPIVRGLPMAYLATGTGSAAAIVAAAEKASRVAVVISRGGRPDLAASALRRIEAPTLFIVGSKDFEMLTANEDACAVAHCDKELRVIAGAGHLFEEPGAIDQAESLIFAWLERHLKPEMAAT